MRLGCGECDFVADGTEVRQPGGGLHHFSICGDQHEGTYVATWRVSKQSNDIYDQVMLYIYIYIYHPVNYHKCGKTALLSSTYKIPIPHLC